MLVVSRWLMGAAVTLVAASGIVVGAQAANLTPAALTLQSGDLPGAKLETQGPVHEKGYVAAYQRSFTYRTPSGRSGIVYVQSEALVAPTSDRAAADVADVRTALTLKVGRAAFIAEIAKSLKVKKTAVKLGALRRPPVGDHALELPISIQTKASRVYESLLYMQLDRVVNVFVSAGVRPIIAADTSRFAAAVAGHIGAALAPVSLAAPTVAGVPQAAEVLTATAGTWSVGDATFDYQWQQCDATGATCTNVAGATAQTYTIANSDVGFTLRVSVTATNRFGSATATSAVTQPVSPAPGPTVQ